MQKEKDAGSQQYIQSEQTPSPGLGKTTEFKSATPSSSIKRPKSVSNFSAHKTEEGIKIVWLGTGEDVKLYRVDRCFGEYTCVTAEEQTMKGDNMGQYIFIDILNPKDPPDKYFISAVDWLNIGSIPTEINLP